MRFSNATVDSVIEKDETSYYKALIAHDSRFDGHFFVAVKTTGIYCRPICRVRTPKEQNCLFFKTAARAEDAGFRPCLKCRPELAPGVARTESMAGLADVAARLIDGGFLQGAGMTGLARQLHVTDRHLRRVFQAATGVSPVAYAQTRKLLLAKQLLTETSLPVTAVAYSAGFESLSRFNSLFKSRYHLAPRQIRGHVSMDEQMLHLRIGYRPPLAWDDLLSFLATRAISGVEVSSAGSYMRTVSIVRAEKVYEGWIEVSNAPGVSELSIRMPIELSPVTAIVLAKVKHLFDTSCQPNIIAAQLGELGAANPGLRVPGAFDGFEMSVRAVIGQQISVRAATVITGRLTAALGKTIRTPHGGLTTLFPSSSTVAAAPLQQLIDCGLYSQRAETIHRLARACYDGLQLTPEADTERTIATLLQIPGIGEWTAQYIAMRALAWPDAFPHTDYVIKKMLGDQNPSNVLQRAEQWRPWRAYAAMHIWRMLSKEVA